MNANERELILKEEVYATPAAIGFLAHHKAP
jgi:hypothetical protein